MEVNLLMGLRWRQTEVEVDLNGNMRLWESMEDPVMFQVFPFSNMCLKHHLYLTGFFFLHMFWKLATTVTDFFLKTCIASQLHINLSTEIRTVL